MKFLRSTMARVMLVIFAFSLVSLHADNETINQVAESGKENIEQAGKAAGSLVKNLFTAVFALPAAVLTTVGKGVSVVGEGLSSIPSVTSKGALSAQGFVAAHPFAVAGTLIALPFAFFFGKKAIDAFQAKKNKAHASYRR